MFMKLFGSGCVPIHMQELAPDSRHSSLSGTAVKQSSEGSRNLVCTLASVREHVSSCDVGRRSCRAADPSLLRNFDSLIREARSTTATDS
ncbi:unnamed protein product [Colias eurytheme]|nr:unnamed protein product [Colias eurytheme]